MDPRVTAYLAQHEGLIPRWVALDMGVSPTTITALLRDSEWCVAHHGVYCDGVVWHSLDEWRGKPLWRAKAAVLAMRRAWVLSHDSAAHLHGLDMLTAENPLVHVTRRGHTNAWTKGVVAHHLARYAPEQVVTIDGYPALDMARTVADVSREHGVRHGLVVADSAMRHGVSKEALWEAVAVMRNWPGVTQCRTVIEMADPRAQNAAESLGREFVVGLGIGEPDPQFPLHLSNGRIAWFDIRVGRHIFEVHGLIKYLTPEDGGVADRSPARVAFEERKREALVRAEGLGLTPLYWDDFFGEGRKRAETRALGDWRETVERLGTELPERLIRNAQLIREQHHPPGAA